MPASPKRELTPRQLRAARAIYKTRGPDLAYIAAFLRVDLTQLRQNESYLAAKAAVVLRSMTLPRWPGRSITPKGERQGEVMRAFNEARASKEPVPFELVSEYYGIQMDLLQIIRDELVAGSQRAFTALKHGLPHAIVQDCARALRIPVSPPPKTARCGSMIIRDILALVDQGVVYRAIATQAGVSQERIRQIAHKMGSKTRRQQLADRKLAAKEEKARLNELKPALRLEAMRQRFKSVNAMYKRGASVEQMAKKVGCTVKTMSQHILRCRKELGAGWFPYRIKRKAKATQEGLHA